MYEKVYIDKDKRYLKGNLHTHTNLSDGKYSVSDVLKIYAENGYDFIGMTDHDMYYEAPNKCHDLVVLSGQEVTCDYIGDEECKGAYVHFSCFQKNGTASEPMQYKNLEELQACIDCLKSKYRLVQLNHPMFSAMFAKLTDADILSLKGYDFLEIYNHKDYLNETGILDAEALVHTLLNHGKKSVLTAGDDFHGPYKKTAIDYFGGGYIMLHAEKNEESIYRALENGEFYATMGPHILDYRQIGNCLFIYTTPAKNIIFYTNLRHAKNIYSDQGAPVTFGEYAIRDADRYVWVKITDMNGRIAWTQPIYLKS